MADDPADVMAGPTHPDTDLLIVGAGPAGLAAALGAQATARTLGRTLRIDVIEKAASAGAHAVSGAIVDPAALRLLGGGDLLLSAATSVPEVGLVALRPRSAYNIPSAMVPPFLTAGGCCVHLPALVRSLCDLAMRRGIQVHSGLAVQGLAYCGRRVIGVRIGEGNPQQRPTSRGTCETITARHVIVADGANGLCSADLRQRWGQQPQAWSLGIKWTVQDLQPNRPSCVHLFGWPLPPTVCGGGFCYRTGDGQAHIGVVMPLTGQTPARDPLALWERLRSHPFMRERCGDPIGSAGARLLPEGGLASLGPLWVPGALVVGDAAGLVDARRQRGVEMAILSGLAAGRCIVRAPASQTIEPAYRRLLSQLGVMRHLRRARNFRQVFDLPGGPLLAPVQELLPLQLQHRPLRSRTSHRPQRLRAKDVFSAWSYGRYPRHVLPHVGISAPQQCQVCAQHWGQPCVSTCPAGVFAPRRDGSIAIAHDNCVQCRSCVAICPQGTIAWTAPAEGSGPRQR